MKTQDAIHAIRKGDPLKHDTIQEIGDMLEDLLMTNKERGEKIGRLRTRIEAEEAMNFDLEEANKRFAEALTPSASTKYAYSGEFRIFLPPVNDEDGEEIVQPLFVPWDTIKDIMSAIHLAGV